MSNNFSSRLKTLRQHFGFSQANFAQLIEVPMGTYRRYEDDRDTPFSVVEKVINRPEFKPYGYWLTTGETQPSVGNIAPGDEIDTHSELSEEEFEKEFIDKSVGMILMFCHMGWFHVNKEKNIDIDDCGKLLLKEVKPLIDSKVTSAKATIAVSSVK
ncbi:helix-turn-helix transcriptional regulator [Pseudoalteromonas luteoviolacea]|uniref:helix-turn-helix transcriptional regulator n=1 Tax=Pseudoalteromonas luteoviolacea TaxID=43657 RepID=UPI001B386537|nr:helix-turn-helix transcriptional regulator [Pseudoalteromonas luteoviolacea]MBQ4836805.1 helix-turn-helix transcriptional regulator [Pseudoalteromonas luteoviolacea]